MIIDRNRFTWMTEWKRDVIRQFLTTRDYSMYNDICHESKYFDCGNFT